MQIYLYLPINQKRTDKKLWERMGILNKWGGKGERKEWQMELEDLGIE